MYVASTEQGPYYDCKKRETVESSEAPLNYRHELIVQTHLSNSVHHGLASMREVFPLEQSWWPGPDDGASVTDDLGKHLPRLQPDIHTHSTWEREVTRGREVTWGREVT